MPKYKPEIFDATNLKHAKEIILTFDGSRTPEERWQRETPIVAELLATELSVAREHLVLDYGCGVGRLAKALIDRQRCSVVGVDISLNMLQMATGYVGSAGFAGLTPQMLDLLVARGVRFDCAHAIWVIQHCFEPRDDLRRIARSLTREGRFVMLSTRHRCVPTDKGWTDDRVDLVPILHELFDEVTIGTVPAGVEPPTHVGTCYVAICRGAKAS